MRNFDSLHDSFVQKMAFLQLVITLQPHFDDIFFIALSSVESTTLYLPIL